MQPELTNFESMIDYSNFDVWHKSNARRKKKNDHLSKRFTLIRYPVTNVYSQCSNKYLIKQKQKQVFVFLVVNNFF